MDGRSFQGIGSVHFVAKESNKRSLGMKILSVNGSPHKEKGNTYIIVKAFLEGAKEEGAEIQEIFLQDKKIGYCLGCYMCWAKSPGKCIQKDDMRDILSQVLQSDILVLSTPVYIDGVSAQTKTFIDRLIPILKAHFTVLNGHCRHKIGVNKMPGLFLISSCGFMEMDNFEPMIESLKKGCLNLYMEYKGHLLRPGSHLMRLKEIYGAEIDTVLKAAKDAGRELIKFGKVNDETVSKVAVQFCDTDEFIKQTNRLWDMFIENVRKKK